MSRIRDFSTCGIKDNLTNYQFLYGTGLLLEARFNLLFETFTRDIKRNMVTLNRTSLSRLSTFAVTVEARPGRLLERLVLLHERRVLWRGEGSGSWMDVVSSVRAFSGTACVLEPGERDRV